jgi:methyl-accepting chemotaxis protein
MPAGGPPKRKLRNYLLDSRFQLKYTGMVVAITVVVASVLGYFAYDYSRGQTDMMTIQMAMQDDLDPAAEAEITAFAQEQDRKVLGFIVAGIVLLALTLGLTGIVITHKLVGPAYKMRMQLRKVAEGKLTVQGRLRKGDELQELFEAFEHMVESLRAAQAREIAAIDAALEQARTLGADDQALAAIVEVRNRMQASLD